MRTRGRSTDDVFIAAIFARAFVPSTLVLLLDGRRVSSSSVTAAVRGASGGGLVPTTASLVLTVALLVIAGLRVLESIDAPPGKRAASWLLLALGAWILIVSAGPGEFSIWWSAPLAVLASIAVRPPAAASAVRAIAAWTAVVGACSIAAGVASAEWAFVRTSDDRWNLLPGGRLAGIASHPNELGLLLAVGLPFLVEARRSLRRGEVLVLLTVTALVATSSRTALFAAGVALLAQTLLKRRYRRQRLLALPTMCWVLSVLPVVGVVPGIIADNGRPELWDFARHDWRLHTLRGAGPHVWADLSQRREIDFDFAFHAHNLGLDLLMVGGAVAAALCVAWVVALLRQCESLPSGQATPCFAAVCALGVLAFSEVPLNFVSLDGRFALATVISALAGRSETGLRRVRSLRTADSLAHGAVR